MPLNLRATQKIRNFNVPVSYRINDKSGKFIDARNVYSVQDRLDTRFGSSRYNSESLGGAIQSLSFFAKSNGQRHAVAKVGADLFSVSLAGAHTLIKSGLSPNSKHRAITGNDRHIIALENDGLFTWDGTTFTQLGQSAPKAPTIGVSAGGALVNGNKYKVALTYYASSIGFESHYIGINDKDNEYTSESSEVTATSPSLLINVSNIPITADNALVDKVYIYLKNVTTNSKYLFVGEVNLGTSSFDIGAESLSTQVPPENNGAPLKGGGKYLANFNSKTVYAGNSKYPNEVYFSEPDIPDAYNPNDSRLVLPIPGKGPVTGLGVGLFGDSVLDPFLVIFKAKSTRVYSEIGGIPKMVVLSEEIGCVSQDTIQVKNGVIYFLSEEGWRAIANGRFVTNKQGEAITLGNGDIDDIFKSSGYYYEVNRNGLPKTFSVYYPTLDQYITWVSEASNAAFTKAYVYEFDVGGFKPYEFSVPATCAVLGESSTGRDVVLFGTANGYILKHSIGEQKSDVDIDNTEVAISAFAVLPWLPDDGDYDATYNYRELILKAITSDTALMVKSHIDYNLTTAEEKEYDFSSPVRGFVLDESILDQGVFGDERSIVTARADINRVGESIAIGFYQDAIGANIGLISMQIDSSKNGNRNLARDNDEEEGGFDAESNDYYPSVSASVQAAAEYAAQAAASAAALSGSGLLEGGSKGDFVERDTPTTIVWKSGTFVGYSERFDEVFESEGLHDTISKILKITYAAPTISLSASPTQTVREKGVTVSEVTLTADTTKRSDPITQVTFYRAGVLVNTDAAPSPDGALDSVYVNSTPFTDTMTFFAKVSDGTTEVQSNTVTYVYVYPYYYGAGAPSLSGAQVGALTKYVITSNSSINRTFTTLDGDVYYFAYPASYGALTSILDENGFETFSDWTLRTENITGLDGAAVSYRIYEFNNPVVALTTNYTFKR